MKDIGTLVREWRCAPGRDLSTTDLAAKVGTSRQNIENLEAGRVRHPSYIVNLATAMGVSVDQLLGRDVVRVETGETTPTYANPMPQAMLDQLANISRQLPDDTRMAFADALAGFVRSNGAEAYSAMTLAVLAISRSPGK